MKRYQQLFKENPNEDLLLFHGSSNRIKNFHTGIVFLTIFDVDAIHFGMQEHNLGSKVINSYLYTVSAKKGKTKNIEKLIVDFISDSTNPEIIDIEYDESGGDLDIWLEKSYVPKMKKKGFRYLYFKHPSPSGKNEIDVYISLYPDKDLTIFDEEKI